MLPRLGALMELPAHAPLRADEHPKQLGPYRIVERLGSGGQAFVYRARRDDDDGGGDVALKRLHPQLADDERELRAFAREARLAYLVDHPAIRRVHAIRREGADAYLVMEYVEGVSLKEVLKRAHAGRRRLPLAGVVAALHELCRALHYAHELVDELGAPAGIVHRDVSPSNVIVTRGGRLTLIDLGIARSQAEELATDSGKIKGKYGYMAPEVLAGGPFDRKADVFSIGVVAWELVTTQKLYPVVHRPLDLERVRSRVIEPPSRLHPACSPALDAVILRALA
ncbi:MAG: serine/threonine protein kinase, partial [Deltaproteobacteria bacterium]|nr:serine/threonine protein kinase [Kofleriaceae bacterium]